MSAPARAPVFVTVTAAVKAPSAAPDASTTRSEYANFVYERPKTEREHRAWSPSIVTSDGPPRIGCRYEYGCAPAERGHARPAAGRTGSPRP